jgi:crotonobetaine/carnitine-CoA ligase
MASRPDNVLANVIANRAETLPDLDVLTIDGRGVRPDDVRTYRQLWGNAQRMARVLIDQGLQPGEHFGLLMANHAEFVEAMVAASIAGVVFVPIDPRTKGDKLRFMLDSARCRGVIATDYALDHLAGVQGDLAQLDWVIGLATDEGSRPLSDYPGVHSLHKLLPRDVSAPPIQATDPDGPMQLIFTSGTTGDPKGIVMTHRRYCDTSAAAWKLFGYEPQDRPYSGLSLTHANAQIVTLGAALVGGLRAVLSRRFTKSGLWDVTRRHGCTTFTLLGGMTTAVYSEPPKPDDADNPVRFIVSAGMPAAIWRDFERRFGVRIVEFYGAAEGGLTVNPLGMGPVGSIGKCVPSLQYRVVDDAGRDCAPGEMGELLFRHATGAPFKVEYFGNPEASAKKSAGGWLHMGDVVHQDDDGWLYFDFRKGGGIRHNGEFVNTAFVEKVIAECPEVDDVFVYGVPARSGAPGESDVVAAIVPRPGMSFDPQALFRACRARLEPAMVPQFVQELEAIPKTASEKPQERFLVDALRVQPDRVHVER